MPRPANPMQSNPLQQLDSLLCIGCHADDIEIGCGGAVLKLIAEHPQVRVHWVVLSGDEQRAAEARQSAGQFLTGVEHEIIIKDFRDSYFPWCGDKIKEFMHELAACVSPDLILTHRREDMHQDHRTAAELTYNAFRDHLIWEYEIPKIDGDLGQPNVYVPLGKEICDRKVQIIMDAFRSQRGRDWFTDDTFRALLRLRGLECCSPTRFAEAMYCRKMVV